MKKVVLILILIIMSTFAMPIALAVIEFSPITAQAGPAGSASISGTFTVSNLETYDDANYTVEMLTLTLTNIGTGSGVVAGTISYDPSEGTIIANGADQLFSYNMDVGGTGMVKVQSSVTGHYYSNTSLGDPDGFFAASSQQSTPPVTVDSALPEFSSAVFPILLSIILFGIIRRKVE